jgi:hypothetical protein
MGGLRDVDHQNSPEDIFAHSWFKQNASSHSDKKHHYLQPQHSIYNIIVHSTHYVTPYYIKFVVK